MIAVCVSVAVLCWLRKYETSPDCAILLTFLAASNI